MPWKDLGKVVGENGRVGNVDSTYINNGGAPNVSITRSGEDSAPDFTFNFENLVNDPIDEIELDQILDGQVVESANTANGTVLSRFFRAIGGIFAPKAHKHSASDLDSGTIDAARIGNGTITKDMLDKNLGDSLSRIIRAGERVQSSVMYIDDAGPVIEVLGSDGNYHYIR